MIQVVGEHDEERIASASHPVQHRLVFLRQPLEQVPILLGPFELQPVPRREKRVEPRPCGRVIDDHAQASRPRRRPTTDLRWTSPRPLLSSRLAAIARAISSIPVRLDGRCDLERDPFARFQRRHGFPLSLSRSASACLRSRYVTTTRRSDMDMPLGRSSSVSGASPSKHGAGEVGPQPMAPAAGCGWTTIWRSPPTPAKLYRSHFIVDLIVAVRTARWDDGPCRKPHRNTSRESSATRKGRTGSPCSARRPAG